MAHGEGDRVVDAETLPECEGVALVEGERDGLRVIALVRVSELDTEVVPHTLVVVEREGLEDEEADTDELTDVEKEVDADRNCERLPLDDTDCEPLVDTELEVVAVSLPPLLSVQYGTRVHI